MPETTHPPEQRETRHPTRIRNRQKARPLRGADVTPSRTEQGAHSALRGWLLALAFIPPAYAVFTLGRFFVLSSPTEDASGAGYIALVSVLLALAAAWAGGTTTLLLASRKAIGRGNSSRPGALRGWLLAASVLHWIYAALLLAVLAISLLFVLFAFSLVASFGEEADMGEAGRMLAASLAESTGSLSWCAGASAAMMIARKVIGGQNDIKPYGGVRPTGVPATGGSA